MWEITFKSKAGSYKRKIDSLGLLRGYLSVIEKLHWELISIQNLNILM